MEKFSYVLKPITREKSLRNPSKKKKSNRIAFREKRIASESFVGSTPIKADPEILTYNSSKYSNMPILSEIQKNKVTELISSLKSLTLGLNNQILIESDILKRHNTECTKDSNFKSKLDKLQEKNVDIQNDIDSILTLPLLKDTKANFEESLNCFLGVQGNTKGKSTKILLQIVLILEVLMNKMVSLDKFKIMHIISKLKDKGEDVNICLQQYGKMDYFSGKAMNLYFDLLNKLLKSHKTTSAPPSPPKEEIQEPGIHVSGTFEDYLSKQVGCKITQEFINYISGIIAQSKEEAESKSFNLVQAHAAQLAEVRF